MDDTNKVESIMQELSNTSNSFNEAMDDIRDDREAYWDSLTKDQQLKCFCAVVERIVKGELEGNSYRSMIYKTFGFGKESYCQAQMAGFLDLHNSMYAK